MKTPLDPRHLRRRKQVQELFAWEAQSKVKNQKSKIKSHDDGVERTINSLELIDKIISEAAPEWEIAKINQIDLAILRLAVFELVVEATEPPKVIIDEAIELAKEFGNEASPSFINGALAKVLVSRRRALAIIANKLGVETAKLTPEANFKQDLNITDLELADLKSTLERQFAVSFEKAPKIQTVNDLLEIIEEE
ncbi:MAG: phosphopantetheine-binding protein [Patescibacteria group bacterium]|nr:phosphopantetheine-binding protein [Patescibacteria group bacterium]MCL5432074.1 phosphopantetheine-binding protein [Patescibacteria group bacterium]